MPSIALVGEGLTDQIVIEHLIESVCRTRADDPLLITYAQPLRDRSDAHRAPHAGWEKVFEYCQFMIEDALAVNDYVCLHVDTDSGDHVNYGLELTHNGMDRTYTDLIQGARAILIRKMGATATEEALARIVFAVAVHATESWLLLILYGETRLKAPFTRLRHMLGKKGLNLTKEARSYGSLIDEISAKAIRKQIESEHSLGVFLREVRDKVRPTSTEDRANADDNAEIGTDNALPE